MVGLVALVRQLVQQAQAFNRVEVEEDLRTTQL
jgi:hypothetical protein